MRSRRKTLPIIRNLGPSKFAPRHLCDFSKLKLVSPACQLDGRLQSRRLLGDRAPLDHEAGTVHRGVAGEETVRVCPFIDATYIAWTFMHYFIT
jgi:hypothetical protein